MRKWLCAVLLLWPLGAMAQSPFELREAARDAMRGQDWAQAAALYEQMVEANPHDGGIWRALGLARLREGEFDAAIDAYRRALATGTRPASCHYDIACAHAQAGRKEAALDALAAAYAAGYVNEELVRTDTDLDLLRQEPRFWEITGWPDPAVTERHAQWQRDLAYLERRVREVHWRPFGVLPEAEFSARLSAIVANIDARDDLQLRLDVQKLLAALGDGHTSVSPDVLALHHGTPGIDLKLLPIELYWYDDGVRVFAATHDHEDLLGARLVAVNGVATEDVIERLRPYVSRDNAWGERWGLMQALADPKILDPLGLGSLEEGFEFTVEMDGTPRPVLLRAGGREALDRRALAQIAGEPPLSWRDKEQHLWMAPLEGATALYVRIDGIRDGHPQTFAQFTDALFETAQAMQAKTLILDLRDNLGGQGHLWLPLLHRLIGSPYDRDGGLYVMVGRKTFSAAMALAAQLEMHTHARFVGEPTGSRPNFVGESSRIRLPYSGLWLSLASRYHQNGGSDDRRLWIAPDVVAAPTFELDRQGRDHGLETLRDLLVRAGTP